MIYTQIEKKEIYNKLINLCEDKKACEDTIKKLFNFKGHHDDYNDDYYNNIFDKLFSIDYAIDPYINSGNDNFNETFNINNVVISLLNAFVDYEYFNYHTKVGNIQDEKHYDYKHIMKKFDYIKKFMETSNDCNFKPPMLPNSTYNSVMYTLIENNMEKDDIENILNTIFDRDKKAQVPKQFKKEIHAIVSMLERILKSAKQSGKFPDSAIKKHQKKIDKYKNPFDF